MVRKLDTKRFYRLMRFLILLVSGVNLILFIVVTANYSRLSQDYFNIEVDCRNFVEETGIVYTDCLADYSNSLKALQSYQSNTLLVGIVLPVVFFGSVYLFKYLFPKTEPITQEGNTKDIKNKVQPTL